MNPDGHPATLRSSHPENAHRATAGVYSERLRDDRAREICAAIMDAPHTVPLDEIGAREIANVCVLIEAIDAEIARKGVGRAGVLLDMRIRASGRLERWLAVFGLQPQARVAWSEALARGGLAAEIARRRNRATEASEA